MLEVILEGVALGITLALLIGPAFFALIQTSIKNGFKSGLAFAFGIFLSDLLCVILAYLGASQLINTAKDKMVMGIIGGIVLIIFGTINIFQKREVKGDTIEIKKANLHLLVIKGFLINILNPFAFVFWLGAVTYVSSKESFSLYYFIVFFSGTLATVLATDVLKSYIALRIRNSIKPNMLIILNRIAGITLIVFGISLILRVIP